MQFCMPHWERLKDAVRDRGMYHLVAKSGEEAHEAAVKQVQGDDSSEHWDPLASATWMIYGRFTEEVGLDAMVGDKCPLCECREGFKAAQGIENGDQIWIDGCTDSLLQEARDRKLVPGEQ